MADPTDIEWQLRVDWDDAGDYSHAEADVTSRVIGQISCYRGRDFDRLVTSRLSPGGLETTLDNSSGDYSFFNSAGPLFDRLRPGRLVQLRSRWRGVWRDRWTGYLLDLPPTSGVGEVPTVQLQAVGILAFYDRQPLDIPLLENSGSGQVVEAALDSAGLPAARRTVDDGQTTFSVVVQASGPLLEQLGSVEAAEVSSTYEATDGGLVVRDRHHRVRQRVSQSTYDDARAAGTLGVRLTGYIDPLQHAYSVFRADVSSYEVDAADEAEHARLWELTGAAIPIAPDSSVVINATANLGREHGAVSSWDAPAVTANSSPDGPGSDRAPDVTTSLTARPKTAVITVTNSNADETVYLVAMTADGVRLRRTHDYAVERTVDDLADVVGGREFPTVPVFSDSDQAEGWISWQSEQYGHVQPVVSITTPATRDEDHLDAALDRDIGDRITVRLEGDSKLFVNGDFFITRITDLIQVDRTMATEYSLIGTAPTDRWWVLGESPGNMVGIPW